MARTIHAAALVVALVLAAGPLASATARPRTAKAASASRVFDYTDEAGTTHLTNVPDATLSQRLTVLVEAEAPSAPAASATPTLTRAALASPEIRSLIDAAARAEHVEPAFIYAVMSAESAFNPAAISAKGAAGLMQLMPETATRYGVSDRLDPRASTFAGARYLHDLLDQFDGDKALALAAYNAGEAAVARYHSTIPPYAETLSYVPRVMALYQLQSGRAVAPP